MREMDARMTVWFTSVLCAVFVVAFVFFALLMFFGGDRMDPIDVLIINDTSKKIRTGPAHSVTVFPGYRYIYENSASVERGGYFRIYAENGELMGVFKLTGQEISKGLISDSLYLLRIKEGDLHATQADLALGEKLYQEGVKDKVRPAPARKEGGTPLRFESARREMPDPQQVK